VNISNLTLTVNTALRGPLRRQPLRLHQRQSQPEEMVHRQSRVPAVLNPCAASTKKLNTTTLDFYWEATSGSNFDRVVGYSELFRDSPNLQEKCLTVQTACSHTVGQYRPLVPKLWGRTDRLFPSCGAVQTACSRTVGQYRPLVLKLRGSTDRLCLNCGTVQPSCS
jgi:hypothetical protein